MPSPEGILSFDESGRGDRLGRFRPTPVPAGFFGTGHCVVEEKETKFGSPRHSPRGSPRVQPRIVTGRVDRSYLSEGDSWVSHLPAQCNGSSMEKAMSSTGSTGALIANGERMSRLPSVGVVMAAATPRKNITQNGIDQRFFTPVSTARGVRAGAANVGGERILDALTTEFNGMREAQDIADAALHQTLQRMDAKLEVLLDQTATRGDPGAAHTSASAHRGWAKVIPEVCVSLARATDPQPENPAAEIRGASELEAQNREKPACSVGRSMAAKAAGEKSKVQIVDAEADDVWRYEEPGEKRMPGSKDFEGSIGPAAENPTATPPRANQDNGEDCLPDRGAKEQSEVDSSPASRCSGLELKCVHSSPKAEDQNGRAQSVKIATNIPSEASKMSVISRVSRKSYRKDTIGSTVSKEVSMVADMHMKKRKTTLNFAVRDSWLSKLVQDSRFDMAISCVVFFNATLIGLQVNWSAKHGEEYVPYTVLDYLCSVVFSAELFARLFGLRGKLLEPNMRYWFAMDMMFVLMSWLDVAFYIIQGGGNAPQMVGGAIVGKVLKISRMARIMRMIRMIRFLSKVRIMVQMIVGSLASLFWLFILVVGVMYIFAVVLTSGMTDWARLNSSVERPVDDGDEKHDGVLKHFGSVPRSMYTLFLTTTNGISWGEPASLTQAAGHFYFCVFIFFVFFTFFSVLNIVTGVFVDGAIQQANGDRSLRMMKELESKKSLVQDLYTLLEHLDRNGDGWISFEEWEMSLRDDHVKTAMALLEIDTTQSRVLFEMLDGDDSGEVSIAEFVEGMQRLRGLAQAIDLQKVIARVNVILQQNLKLLAHFELEADPGEKTFHHHSWLEPKHEDRRTCKHLGAQHGDVDAKKRMSIHAENLRKRMLEREPWSPGRASVFR